MAENRGGMRPTAPQNNPANISATGGAGQSGTQPARYMSGLAYGQGQAQMAQQTSAPMAGNPVATARPMVDTPQMPQVVALDAPIRPAEPRIAACKAATRGGRGPWAVTPKTLWGPGDSGGEGRHS